MTALTCLVKKAERNTEVVLGADEMVGVLRGRWDSDGNGRGDVSRERRCRRKKAKKGRRTGRAWPSSNIDKINHVLKYLCCRHAEPPPLPLVFACATQFGSESEGIPANKLTDHVVCSCVCNEGPALFGPARPKIYDSQSRARDVTMSFFFEESFTSKELPIMRQQVPRLSISHLAIREKCMLGFNVPK